MKSFGEQIRVLRKEQHMTLNQLSMASGVNRSTINSYENQRYAPNMLTAALILDALGYEIGICKKEQGTQPLSPLSIV